MKSLDERLKNATTGSRVSMLPEAREHKHKKEEPVPDLQEVIPSAVTRMKVIRLMRTIREWALAESEAKRNKNPLVDQLKVLLIGEGLDVTKFMADNLRLSMYQVPRSSIKYQKLLEHGISPSIILACTETKQTINLKISEPGEKEEESE